ncbi:MAG TPA: hypothetical protein PK466_09945 [Thermotogota bacterium]|nr:hypothetical protein [Thermotogota bacterium]HPJ89945.1 hypothetical protein [Thermotogota bacterium]HPR96644.1 hypothetical protein [Thermotogota bacterium]
MINKTKLNIWVGILAVVFLLLDYLTGFAIIHFRSFEWLMDKNTAFTLHHYFLPALTFFVLWHVLLSFQNYVFNKKIRSRRIQRGFFITSIGISIFVSLILLDLILTY